MIDRGPIEEKGWKRVQLFADMRNPNLIVHLSLSFFSHTGHTRVHVPSYVCEGVRSRCSVSIARPSDTPACLNAEGTKDKFKRLNEASK